VSAETTQLINQLQIEKSDLEENLVELEEKLNSLEDSTVLAKEREEDAELAKLKAEEVLAEATEMLYQVEKIKDSASAVLDLLSTILASFNQQVRIRIGIKSFTADDIITPATCEEMLATIESMNTALQMGTKEGLREGYQHAVALLGRMSPTCTFDNNDQLFSATDALSISLVSVTRVVSDEKVEVSLVAADLVASSQA